MSRHAGDTPRGAASRGAAQKPRGRHASVDGEYGSSAYPSGAQQSVPGHNVQQGAQPSMYSNNVYADNAQQSAQVRAARQSAQQSMQPNSAHGREAYPHNAYSVSAQPGAYPNNVQQHSQPGGYPGGMQHSAYGRGAQQGAQQVVQQGAQPGMYPSSQPVAQLGAPPTPGAYPTPPAQPTRVYSAPDTYTVPASAPNAYPALDTSYSAEPDVYANGTQTVYRKRKKRRKHRRAPIIAIIVVAAILLVACGVGGVKGYLDAKQLKSDASTVTSDISRVVDQIKDQDYAGASQTAQSISTTARSMNDTLSSPLWKVAAAFPVLGSDVQGAATLVEVLQIASDEMLVPLTSALEKNPPAALVGSDKQINITGVTQLLNAFAAVEDSSSKACDLLDTLPTFRIGQLQSAADKATEKFETIDLLIQTAGAFAPVAANVLGANGDRTYLIAAQNSAEIRASGGFPGSCGTLLISNGKIDMGDFDKVRDALGTEVPDTVQVTTEENQLFNRYYAALTTPYDWCINPHFPRTGEVWAASFESAQNASIAGTIGVTPTMVQKILAITGPITLSDGRTLDGTNATKQLQHDIYWDYLGNGKSSADNADITDALFAEAASLAFSKAFENMSASNLTKLATSLLEGMQTREVVVWMKDTAEQSAIARLGCSGTVFSDASNPVLGIYVNDWSVSKMGWYLDNNIVVTENKNKAGSNREYTVTVTLRNTITSTEAATGGAYIVGQYGGEMEQLPYFFAPAGGSIEMIDSGNATVDTGTYNGQQVLSASVRIPVGGSVTFTMKVTTAADAADLTVASTPTLTEYR